MTRSAEAIAQEADSIGGQIDASTGKENANYSIKVLDEHLPLAVDLLSDLVLHPRCAPEDVEKEKGVVIEEIKMVEDMPDDLVHELFLQGYWEDHPLGRPILGTAESVSSFTPEALRAYFDGADTADRLIVTVAGNAGHQEDPGPGRACLWRRAVRGGQCAGSVPVPFCHTIVRSKELEQSHVCLGVGAHAQGHPDLYVTLVLNTVLGGSMSSRLFQNVREKRGLAYSVGSGLSAVCRYRRHEHLRRLRQREGRRGRGGHVPKSGSCGRPSADRAAARQGQRERRPVARPREHLAPGRLPGPPGNLFRPPLQHRRDPRGDRPRVGRRRGARGPGDARGRPVFHRRGGRRERPGVRARPTAGES